MAELTMQTNTPRQYLPAAVHDVLLPLYDTIAKLMAADDARKILLSGADLKPNERVLDIDVGGVFLHDGLSDHLEDARW